MGDSELVKDVMLPAVRLDMNLTIREAQQLLKEDILFGVFGNVKGKPFPIVTRTQLSAAQADKPVRNLTMYLAHPVPIESDCNLDFIVLTRANDFEFNQESMGIVVEEQGEVRGILLWETIEERVLDMLNTGRLRGTPIGMPLYRCKQCPGDPRCPGVKLMYYDPKNPPECPRDKKRKMMLVKY